MNTAEYLDHYYLITPDYIDAEGNVYDESDLQERYDDMLDEEGPVTIGGLEYSVSRVLQEVDPIAYRCGMADYRDTLEWDEWTENHEWIEDEDEDEDEDEA